MKNFKLKVFACLVVALLILSAIFFIFTRTAGSEETLIYLSENKKITQREKIKEFVDMTNSIADSGESVENPDNIYGYHSFVLEHGDGRKENIEINATYIIIDNKFYKSSKEICDQYLQLLEDER